MTRNKKNILSITIRRMIDESPDTSYLGEYSNRPANEFAIDRAHAEDCASVREDIRQAKLTLEHVQQTIGDMWNATISYDRITHPEYETECEALDDAYDEVGELIDEIDACDCGEHGDMERNEFRYFNGQVERYKGESPEDIRKYTRQDYDRMERLNRGDWCYVGIRAEAEIQIVLPKDADYRTFGEAYNPRGVVQRITSGGLWGIESDSDRSYFAEVQAEELANLKTELLALGFSTRAIATALKDVIEEEN